MSEWHPDRMMLDLGKYAENSRAVFIGIDWGRKDQTAATCPRCQELHCWRKRIPKQCRHCGLPFTFTASSVTA